MDYKINLLTSLDKDKIRKFLEENYFVDDPVLNAMGIYKADEDQIQHILNFLDESYCYAAVDNNGVIIGVLLCGEIYTNEIAIEKLKEEQQKCKSVYFSKLINWYMETSKHCNISNTFGINKALETHIACVRRADRRKGIMKRLFERVIEDAASEYKLIICTCASKYTANLCESLKWYLIYCLPYSQFNDTDGNKLFPNVQHPHLHVRIYAYFTSHDAVE